MKIILSFYVGIQDFLGESEDRSERDLSAIQQSHKIEKALVAGGVGVSMEGLGISWDSPDLEVETVLADDQPNLPLLTYVNAAFQVAPIDEDAVLDVEDELDDLITATLVVGDLTIPFQGAVELETD